MLSKYIDKKILTTLTFFLLQFAFSACKKFIEIPPPADVASTETLFSDDVSAVSAINGLYSQMMTSNLFFANSGFTLMPALSADELYTTSSNGNFDPFLKNSISTDNFYNDAGLWKSGFKLIYQTNAILLGLGNSTNISDGIKNQLIGEAKFVRAFCYFYLINFYGDVPLVMSTDYKVNATLPRMNKIEIYKQITRDLQDAKNLMMADYPSPGKVRPTKSAAVALLARVYLYQGKWADAETESSSLIDLGTYSLSSLNNVFLSNSSEAIWQLLPVLNSINTADGITFIPYSSTFKPSYVLTDWLLNSFEVNDQRKSAWLKSNTVDGQLYYYPFKYKVRSGSAITEYNMVFRLAEEYLIRAESRAQQDNISGAKSDLNIIRNRAGLLNTSANDKSSLLEAIDHENQIEFFAECGHRWFDLKRTGKINSVLSFEKPLDWQPSDSLYPIPLSELLANPVLTQNPGY